MHRTCWFLALWGGGLMTALTFTKGGPEGLGERAWEG